MPNPLISVVMSVYNGSKYLPQSIESVLHQTFSDFEFIIINDGATDDSLEIISNYAEQDERIRIISHENIGLTKSLNNGIALSNTQYIARQDVDDISKPDRLGKQYSVMERESAVAMVASYYELIDENGELLARRSLPVGEKLKKRLQKENVICHSSAFFRKEVFERIGKYDENFRYHQDHDLWKRMPVIEIIPDFLVQYRLHGMNINHVRFKDSITYDYKQYVDTHISNYVISVLLQENDKTKARKFIGKPKNLRAVFYLLLSFLPFSFVQFYFENIKWWLKRG